MISKRMGVVASTLLLFVAAAYCGPKVTVGNAEYDAGTVVEGERRYVQHVFELKNTGDADLTITDVRAG